MFTTLALSAALLQQSVAVGALKTFDGIQAIAVAGAPTGSRFAVSDYKNTVRIMDAAKLATLATLSGHPQPCYALAWNPSGTQLVTGDETARIWVWDAKSGKKLREFARTAQTHQRGIQSISFSSDGKTMISTGKDDVIIVWDFATGKPKNRIMGNGVVFASALFHKGGILAATLTEGIHWRKPGGYALGGKFNGHGGQGVQELSRNIAGSRFVSAGRDMAVCVWDGQAMKKLGDLRGHQDSVQHVAIAPNGRVAASSANDRFVYVWDIVRMKQMTKIGNQCAVGSPLAFTGDGKYLITVNVNDFLQVNSVTPPQGAVTAVRRRK